ncbi:hypothetical protein PIIN_09365 [Serendipita indica DSM 11827]|uniref:Cytochrome P450 n=1 Tax=Serendipita indica (strain DSM 11827) TaxID=1109443 RepID=G4TVN8_SERID|nr:hypothetical protein PIIN_09365 [Serendipita indica DSM 11827]
MGSTKIHCRRVIATKGRSALRHDAAASITRVTIADCTHPTSTPATKNTAAPLSKIIVDTLFLNPRTMSVRVDGSESHLDWVMQHLPDWLPGLTFKRIIRRANILIRKIRYQPFESIVSRIADGTADESLLVKYLDEGSFSHNNLRDAIATLYGAAIDTTSTALLNLFLYHHSVLGRGHLPTREEIRNLSIFNAVWKEAFRLNPPAPIGVPHVGMKEDVWRGYYFPKGTIVHCNIGQNSCILNCLLTMFTGYILREKGIWGEDSHSFNPTRFLPEFNPRAAELPNMLDLPFGFGRRICPGRHLADHIAPQYAVALLVTYQILPMEGHLLGGKIGFADSAVRRISGFQCHFKPRS